MIIESAIEELKDLDGIFNAQISDAINTGIRSLEAWDKAWYDILNHEDVWGTGEILEVLEKHLKGVEE